MRACATRSKEKSEKPLVCQQARERRTQISSQRQCRVHSTARARQRCRVVVLFCGTLPREKRERHQEGNSDQISHTARTCSRVQDVGRALVFWARPAKKPAPPHACVSYTCVRLCVCRCLWSKVKASRARRRFVCARRARCEETRARGIARAHMRAPPNSFGWVCVCVCARGGRSRLLRDKNCFKVQARDGFEDRVTIGNTSRICRRPVCVSASCFSPTSLGAIERSSTCRHFSKMCA